MKSPTNHPGIVELIVSSGVGETVLPAFWSHQFGVNIKSVGFPSYADQVVLTQGSVAAGRFTAAYGRRGRMVGAVAVDMPRNLDAYAALIRAGAPFPPDLHAPDQPSDEE